MRFTVYILNLMMRLKRSTHLVENSNSASSPPRQGTGGPTSIRDAEWLPTNLSRLDASYNTINCCFNLISFLHSRQSRLDKAMNIMEKNDEGILWVKLLSSKTVSSNTNTKTATLIPIRWVKSSSNHPTKQQIVAAVHSLSPHDHEHDTLPPDPKSESRMMRSEMLSTEAVQSDVADPPPAAVGSHDTTRRSKEREDDENVCVVCMERAADFQLLPCRHDRFCRQCIVETICTWVRPEAPCCPLCRGAFHTMVLLDGTD